ncbi:hypothetical protein DY000_02020065 [Brassica cretica]|uniref:Uncharacterized protein n=1 Tax=Brassica cretica TaxID=69181 RepID=A0ABQ7EGY6_BRACR|nr:hypothetical protein DY000_02020065 [Brassica cretica]
MYLDLLCTNNAGACFCSVNIGGSLKVSPCFSVLLGDSATRSRRYGDLAISACSTSAHKQDDLRQLATRSGRWTARVPDLSNQTARDNIISRSDQFQLAVHLFGASAQGVSDPNSDDLGLFNLSSQTRRSQTARDPISTLDSSCSPSQQLDSSRQHQLAFRSVPARGSSLWWSIQPYLRLR